MQKISWTKGLKFLFFKSSCEWIGMTLRFQEINKQRERTENLQKKKKNTASDKTFGRIISTNSKKMRN